MSDGTFGESEVPEAAVKTREKLQAAVKGGAFAQMLTTMMPLGRPGYPDEIGKGGAVLGIRHGQLHQRRQPDRRWRADPAVTNASRVTAICDRRRP